MAQLKQFFSKLPCIKTCLTKHEMQMNHVARPQMLGERGSSNIQECQDVPMSENENGNYKLDAGQDDFTM